MHSFANLILYLFNFIFLLLHVLNPVDLCTFLYQYFAQTPSSIRPPFFHFNILSSKGISTILHNFSTIILGLSNNLLAFKIRVNIYDNTASDHAGGIMVLDGSNPIVKSVILHNNVSGNEGGAITIHNSSITIDSLEISNISARVGAGIYIANHEYPNNVVDIKLCKSVLLILLTEFCLIISFIKFVNFII